MAGRDGQRPKALQLKPFLPSHSMADAVRKGITDAWGVTEKTPQGVREGRLRPAYRHRPVRPRREGLEPSRRDCRRGKGDGSGGVREVDRAASDDCRAATEASRARNRRRAYQRIANRSIAPCSGAPPPSFSRPVASRPRARSISSRSPRPRRYRPPTPETVLPNVAGPTYAVGGLRPALQLNPRPTLS